MNAKNLEDLLVELLVRQIETNSETAPEKLELALSVLGPLHLRMLSEKIMLISDVLPTAGRGTSGFLFRALRDRLIDERCLWEAGEVAGRLKDYHWPS